MLRLEIASLKSGVRTETFEPEAGVLDLDEAVLSQIRIVAHLERVVDRVHAQLELSANARLQCDRTLVDYDQPIEGHCRLLFVPTAELAGLGGEDDDVRELAAGDTDVDVTDVVRDTLLLAIPLRRVAPGAEAMEIPSAFGEPDEDDVDPRWETLKRLRTGEGSDD